MNDRQSGPTELTTESGTAPGATPMARLFRSVKPFHLAGACVQFLLILAVMWTFRIEDRSVLWVMTLTLPAFVLHHLLPMGWRLPFFALVSLASVGFVYREAPAGAAYLVGSGIALIALCHLPVAFRVRVVLLVAAAAGLAVLRGRVVELPPIVSAIWPILGSMFMFRIIVYMHDLRTKAAPFGVWKSLGYFFMLPNVCFPMFPLVDYKTYTRTYYNDEAFHIYQSGLSWMMRGVIQLLLYRFIYQNLLIPGSEVESIGGVARYMLTTYLLYLHISGLFHLIVGALHMFGFNLPETHHRFLLASSFIDFWRRINIYWKDFMQKVFFFPAYFRLKGVVGERRALEVATIFVFLVTWAFHSYQWYWLLGSFPIKAPDIVFWGLLGVLVLANELYRTRKGAKRRTLKQARSIKGELAYGARTVATFTAICVLWSLWNSPSLGEWWEIVRQAGHAPAGEVAIIVGFLLLIGVLGITMGHSSAERTEGRIKPAAGPGTSLWRPAAGVVLLALLAIGARQLPLVLSPGSTIGRAIEKLTTEELNAADAALMERGYYEDLTDVGLRNPELAKLFTNKPSDWKDLHQTDAVIWVDTVLDYELRPSHTLEFKRETMTTNEWGMRDRPYERAKPAGAYRIGVLGSSHSMGSGVGDEETYENVVEDRLNAAPGSAPSVFEILNFSVAGYGSVAQLEVLTNKAFAFDLDMACFEVHINESQRTVRHLLEAWSEGKAIPEYVTTILAEAGISPNAPRYRVERQLKTHADDVVRAVLLRFGEACRARGVEPVLFLMPKPDNVKATAAREETRRWLEEIARTGDMTFFDIADAYDGEADPTTLMIAPWDGHPTAEAHRLLADRLFERLAVYLRQRSILPRERGTPTNDPSNER